MASLSQELKRWAVEELELPAARLPDDGYIKTLCVGPGASIWKYITQHIYKERNVRVMRGNIQWYKVLQDKELKQLKNQNKDARRLELQREIDALQTELNQLDTKISRVEDQLATEERNVNGNWEDFMESRHRPILLDSFRQRCSEERNVLLEDTHVIGTQRHALEELSKAERNVNGNWEDFMESRHRPILLDSFRQRCSEERNVLLEDTHVIGTQRHALEELSKKAEVKLVFGPSDSSDSEAGADPLVLKDVRELCSERVLFFQGLLQSELNVNPSTEFTHEQRKAVIQHWTSAVENVLRSHPPNQVLSALQALTSRQQVALEEKIAALNVERDVSDLGFRYESDHLIDVSAEQKEELTPVHSLLQSAWEEVEQSYFELAQTRNRCGQLETELTTLMRKAETAHGSDPVSRWKLLYLLLNLQCLAAQLHHKLAQSKSVVGQFVQEKLNPQFGSVIKASSELRNSVSQGAKHFSCVALAALNRRAMKGGQKLPAAQLSIHRIQSSAFHKLCQSLSFPMYMAPEELWSQAAVLRLELRHLRRLLQLFSESSADLQKLTARLPSPDQQTLVQRVKMVDDEILQTLLPRARELTQRCSKGLLYTDQVKTAITHWWEQPGQFALPEMQREGLTFQQWLQRWKLATKES
ncbi:HAUS augmin-like complex subunit 5 [Sinocyclocheilus anshuiensis]|uniref:HAUS augmin-like complex subunit 5 n=1 Tax=Sinocyclocheilus anshuiensis TaxID=1608454 RepID=UPI0007B85BC5|nr:PREDICTED: HAUS augmin-like complex subunit 5 [Sinocyclocheilus anshuiensis]